MSGLSYLDDESVWENDRVEEHTRETAEAAAADEERRRAELNLTARPQSSAATILGAATRRQTIVEERSVWNHVWLVVIIIIVAVYVRGLDSDVNEMISAQNPFFDEKTLLEFQRNSMKRYDLLGINRTRLERKRVVLMILDGARLDYTSGESNAFGELVNSERFKRDGLLWDMTNQIPTISVPNWYTIVSSVIPEMSGFLANSAIGERAFDNIFRRCLHHDEMCGVTGYWWWNRLLASDLPAWAGNGVQGELQSDLRHNFNSTTNRMDYRQYDTHTVDRLLQALKTVIVTEPTETFTSTGFYTETGDSDNRQSTSDSSDLRRRVHTQSHRYSSSPYDSSYTHTRTGSSSYEPLGSESTYPSGIRSTDNPDFHERTFRFLLAHLDAPDEAAHGQGVTGEYDIQMQYDAALKHCAEQIERVMDFIDQRDDTVLIVTADHGHADRGGHGGTEEVLRHVMFSVYAPGTGLGALAEPDVDRDPNEPYVDRPLELSNVDIAPTIAALTGLPVPRQALGRIPMTLHQALVVGKHSRVEHLRDLLAQKQEWFALFVGRCLGSKDVTIEDVLNDNSLMQSVFSKSDDASTYDWGRLLRESPDTVVTNVCGTDAVSFGGMNYSVTVDDCEEKALRDAVTTLHRLYDAVRDREFTSRVVRNLFLNLITASLTTTILFVTFSLGRLVNPQAAFFPTSVLFALGTTEKMRDDRRLHIRILRAINPFSIVPTSLEISANRIAAVCALASVVTSYVVALALFLIVYLGVLGEKWTFAMWNEPSDAYIMLAVWIVSTFLITLIVESVVSLIILRLIFRSCAESHRTRVTMRVLYVDWCVLLFLTTAVFIWIWTCVYGSMLFPDDLKVHFVSAFTWDLRFRLTGLMFMSIGHLCASLCLSYLVTPTFVAFESQHDGLLLLWWLKNGAGRSEVCVKSSHRETIGPATQRVSSSRKSANMDALRHRSDMESDDDQDDLEVGIDHRPKSALLLAPSMLGGGSSSDDDSDDAAHRRGEERVTLVLDDQSPRLSVEPLFENSLADDVPSEQASDALTIDSPTPPTLSQQTPTPLLTVLQLSPTELVGLCDANIVETFDYMLHIRAPPPDTRRPPFRRAENNSNNNNNTDEDDIERNSSPSRRNHLRLSDSPSRSPSPARSSHKASRSGRARDTLNFDLEQTTSSSSSSSRLLD